MEVTNEKETGVQNQKSYNLASFQRSFEKMIATSTSAYNSYARGRTSGLREYSEEEIQNIIESGDLFSQQKLSRNYFYKDGFYKQIIIYYATLLKYAGLLIPNPSYGKKLTSPNIQKRYYAAIDYVERMNLQNFFTNCAQTVLIDGCYYGVIVEASRERFSVLDLPSGYACSRFKDADGNDIVEFDLGFFSSIISEEDRKAAFAAYPPFFEKAYKKWIKNKGSRWIMLPAGLGICFPFFDGRPLFLSMIPTTIQYDKAVDTEQKRDLEEIRKIIVQKIPHLQDGRLLFEPEEAVEIHAGTVNMMRNNENVSVLTTYADTDAIVSKTSSDTGNSTLDRMLNNIYAHAGVSSQLFASTGSSTLESSVKTDISLMMYLANKFANFVTNIINLVYSNGNINFKYIILPVGEQNAQKYIDTQFKLASSGYSLLIPAIASGISQRNLIGLKELENDVLKLYEKLIPLTSSYTQSSGTGKVGRPKKEQEDKNERTIQNEDSADNQV